MAANPAEEIAKLRKEIEHHNHLYYDLDDPVLSDINAPLMLHTAREARLYPGEGAMDIAGMVSAMPEIPLSIELPNLERIQELGVEGHARRCLETAKAYFKEHGVAI